MSVQKSISPDVAQAIVDVMVELSSELDLHYEDSDFFALGPTIEKMKTMAELLEKDGYPLPDAYKHIVSRYHRHRQ